MAKLFKYRAASGYPLVVLANGNYITWLPEYFNQTTVQKVIASPCCGLPLLSGLDRTPLSKFMLVAYWANAVVGLRPCDAAVFRKLVFCYMAVGQLAGLYRVLTALQMILPTELARIAASSPQHVWSGLWYWGSIGKLRLPSDSVPVARTTAKSR
ncbi:MAG: hypothetical protein RIS47_2274 [Bacteroidota bacterium]